MKKTLLSIVGTVAAGALFSYTPSAQAAILPAALSQDNIVATFSQDISVQITHHDYDGDRLFVQLDQNGTDLDVSVYPSSVTASFVIITEDQALIAANPDLTFVSQAAEVVEEVVESPEDLPDVVDKWKTHDLVDNDEVMIMSENANSRVTASKNFRTYTSPLGTQVSPVYEIYNPDGEDLSIALTYDTANFGHQQPAYFDLMTLSWIPIVGYNHIDESRVFFEFNGDGRVAIFESYESIDGKASWYDQSYYGTFDYQNGMFAAHRDWAKGSQVKVTRLKTGKSIIVTINDWGPEEWTGRVIDLDKAAFEAIASTGAGEVYVNIELLSEPA